MLATSAWSLGSALALNLLLGSFRRTLAEQLVPLGLSDDQLQVLTRLVASGQREQVLAYDFGVPDALLLRHVSRSAAPTVAAIMNVLHGMGWLVLGMLALVTVLVALSRRSAVAAARP